MNEDQRVDAAAEDAQAFDDLMGRNRQCRMLEDTEPEQPKVTDWTMVLKVIEKSQWIPDKYVLAIRLGAGRHHLGEFSTRELAERAELALNQAMIEYRTKRNSWERML
jgi:hypothetical protein